MIVNQEAFSYLTYSYNEFEHYVEINCRCQTKLIYRKNEIEPYYTHKYLQYKLERFIEEIFNEIGISSTRTV